MPDILETWTVLPHGPLKEVDDGILTVTGQIPMPLGNFPRAMTVVRLRANRTAIWSAIAQPEAEMARIEALGTPSFLIVPNPGHRVDARIWKARYPDIRVLTSPGARKDVEAVVPVDIVADRLDDPEASFVVVPGTDEKESAMTVRRADGTTLVTNDIIGHVRHPHGLGAKIMVRLFGYGVSGPRMPRTVSRFIKDRAALAGQLRAWADIPDLVRIIVSHGEPITGDPAGVLRRIADGLQR